LAQGDQTLIGERGCTLSGGQKARVAFARAIYTDSDILILDDVLSAVDAHVGSFIFFETLCNYCKGKTILMVTHALNFVQHTDRILMMENC
jgi:ABC-type multidrug transport system fused ATPase/permease subunit